MPPSQPRYLDGSRIVYRGPGQGTGDNRTVTEDGRVWHTHDGTPPQTGQTIAKPQPEWGNNA